MKHIEQELPSFVDVSKEQPADEILSAAKQMVFELARNGCYVPLETAISAIIDQKILEASADEASDRSPTYIIIQMPGPETGK